MKKINKTMSDFFTACDGLSRSDEREFFDKYLDVKMPVLIRELIKVIQGGEFSDYCRDKAKQIYAKNNPPKGGDHK